jgi:hypothetical protein
MEEIRSRIRNANRLFQLEEQRLIIQLKSEKLAAEQKQKTLDSNSN